ncbi:MAG: 4-(cytidine 5'-diphospho)-2-C-methyl-D-erythritol kinase [Sphingobacteriales bacterium]|nr:MAG: 4-(cytidine 5'-diphospho)-2-C-methyl-D-erythritol kinase [Sphingobacteriales bacterium]
MICFPNVKINIGLYITGKRNDGFHNLESIFCPVPFCDVLEIIPAKKFTFQTEGIAATENPEDNLCVKAYRMLQQDFDLEPVEIFLLKNIPTGAGLGGGSSDASFTLKLLNTLFKLNLSDGKLIEYAAKLGSDCPFFIINKPAYVFGRGELQEQTDLDLSGKYITIIHPGIHISTKDAFANITPQQANIRTYRIPDIPLTAWKNMLRNDFEPFAFKSYPILQDIKNSLYLAGAEYVSMSGSGSAIYAISEKYFDVPQEWKMNYVVWQGKL